METCAENTVVSMLGRQTYVKIKWKVHCQNVSYFKHIQHAVLESRKKFTGDNLSSLSLKC